MLADILPKFFPLSASRFYSKFPPNLRQNKNFPFPTKSARDPSRKFPSNVQHFLSNPKYFLKQKNNPIASHDFLCVCNGDCSKMCTNFFLRDIFLETRPQIRFPTNFRYSTAHLKLFPATRNIRANFLDKYQFLRAKH